MTTCRATGKSPYELRFGYSPKIAIDNILETTNLTPQILDQKSKTHKFSKSHTKAFENYKKQLLKQLSIIHNEALIHREKYNKEKETAHNKKVINDPLKKGEYIMRKLYNPPGNRTKYYPKWEAGWTVIKRKSNTTYLIANHKGEQCTDHRKNLKRYVQSQIPLTEYGINDPHTQLQEFLDTQRDRDLGKNMIEIQ